MLGGDIAVAGPAAPPVEKAAPAAPPAAAAAPVSVQATPHAAGSQDVRSVPRWLTYERKETRIRPDQLEWVEAQRKELNQRRQGAGERLTDNTLIRVALDLLIKHQGELQGVTEDQLRQSLGLTD
uniref:hypothetical protein n=1 Tax=Cryobacterium sp. TaxID=1926290 RepID=UPI0021043B24|nr:hypothetical protein [Cryobacterium sp.]